MTASQSTALMRWKMRSRRMPALLTTQSMRPKLSIAVLMMRSAPCGSATLSPLATALPPAFLISATTWSATLTSAPSPSAEPPRSLTTTLAPSAAASSAISRADAAPRAGDDDDFAFNALVGHACVSLSASPPLPHAIAGRGLEVRGGHERTSELPHAPHPDPLPQGGGACGERRRSTTRPYLPTIEMAAHVALREAAEVVGEAEARLVLALALAGAALHLQVHLVDHAQARGADRMAEALQAAVDLARHLAVGIVEAVEHVLDGAALGRDVQVLHGDELGHREAVVHLDQADLLARACRCRPPA